VGFSRQPHRGDSSRGKLLGADPSETVFDHLDLPVRDFAASVAFYRIALAPLGIEQTSEDPPEFGALSFIAQSSPQALHFSFIAETSAAVRAFHRAGIGAGYRSNGEPGVRQYAWDYYAAYLLDPDGHNVEAVHRSAETRATWNWLGIGMVSPSTRPSRTP
jgi:catechol 2,3-dioxygenase-like lactoylglutathione lyase family enzyme